jgi:hypothetical protein
MNRDLVINILLILAGLVLAIALFGAGVLWKSRAPTKAPGLVKPHAGETAKQPPLLDDEQTGSHTNRTAVLGQLKSNRPSES